MKPNRFFAALAIGAILICGLAVGGFLLYNRGRPAPLPVKEILFNGVTYTRQVRVFPPMITHMVVIDMRANGLRFFVTPPDSNNGAPLKARTTSQFLNEFGLQIAVNGDGFSPWWSHSPADYYPHVGDPITPNGFAASNGKVYSTAVESDGSTEPTLYIGRRNDMSFNNQPGKVFSAISGDRMLVLQGKLVDSLDDQKRDPRTAIGVNRNGRWLILVVVDGRQPYYSDGATFTELADILIKQGAYYAMNLDGGGSSTLVIEGKNGRPEVLNSPIDNYIPGRERPVGNHFGVYLK